MYSRQTFINCYVVLCCWNVQHIDNKIIVAGMYSHIDSTHNWESHTQTSIHFYIHLIKSIFDTNEHIWLGWMRTQHVEKHGNVWIT